MRDVEVLIKNVQIDVQTRQNSIKRMADQQFETRKNDEFQAMGNEIIRYKREVSALEDIEIGHMEKLEAAKAIEDAAKAKLAVTQASVDEDIAQLTERAKVLEVRIAELKAERLTLLTDIDEEALEQYDRLMKNKGSAVVPASGGNCGGCHMKLINSTVVTLKAEDCIVHCEQCGRMLYEA